MSYYQTHKIKKKHMHKHTASRFGGFKLFVYIGLTLLLLLAWVGSSSVTLKVLVIGYALYRFVKLAAENFGCMGCWRKFGMSAVLGILFLGIFPVWFYPAAIALLWIEPYL